MKDQGELGSVVSMPAFLRQVNQEIRGSLSHLLHAYSAEESEVLYQRGFMKEKKGMP